MFSFNNHSSMILCKVSKIHLMSLHIHIHTDNQVDLFCFQHKLCNYLHLLHIYYIISNYILFLYILHLLMYTDYCRICIQEDLSFFLHKLNILLYHLRCTYCIFYHNPSINNLDLYINHQECTHNLVHFSQFLCKLYNSIYYFHTLSIYHHISYKPAGTYNNLLYIWCILHQTIN